jgi:hypothetical protein
MGIRALNSHPNPRNLTFRPSPKSPTNVHGTWQRLETQNHSGYSSALIHAVVPGVIRMHVHVPHDWISMSGTHKYMYAPTSMEW